MDTTDLNINQPPHKALKALLMATLLGSGDLYKKGEEKLLYFQFERNKSAFLNNYILANGLQEFVKIDLPKQQAFIVLEDHDLYQEVLKWYDGHNKRFLPSNHSVSYHDIILFIIIFGKRRLESVTVETTLDKNSLRSFAYVLETKLDLSVIPDKMKLKIHDIVSLFINGLKTLGMLECTELANFLSEQDKRIIANGVKAYAQIG
ncbi:hypothetical protein HPT25_27865 [Bacillus sp. BRMEA1]|uniref:hypothetical protein n=1 Tax=Neobacillus endophyticus TaxID=2738405 RepID=UPI00156471BD|nr:hypothetical protein [Neobacillus endophyticus]NRD81112.1 hypothetical protein [Neobacillus endophyticus]